MSAAATDWRPEGRDPTSKGSLTRRTLLVAGASVAASAAFAVVTSERVADGTLPVSRSAAPPLRTLARPLGEVAAEAFAAAGARFAASPWQSHFQVRASAVPWSAIFVAWLLRDNDVALPASPLELHREYVARGAVGTEPRPGALIFYSPGDATFIDHVGFVDAVRGASISTIEADVPGTLPPEATFVRRFGQPWTAPVAYAYPVYGR